MNDGVLGKCKTCSKIDVALRIEKKKKDSKWLIKEAERCRLKSQKRVALGLSFKRPSIKEKESQKKSRLLHPLNFRARGIVASAIKKGIIKPCVCWCGKKAEAHHEDYSKPLDVVWLCKKHHMERHVEINNLKRMATCTP